MNEYFFGWPIHLNSVVDRDKHAVGIHVDFYLAVFASPLSFVHAL
jgi:hypothetical protein